MKKDYHLYYLIMNYNRNDTPNNKSLAELLMIDNDTMENLFDPINTYMKQERLVELIETH